MHWLSYISKDRQSEIALGAKTEIVCWLNTVILLTLPPPLPQVYLEMNSDKKNGFQDEKAEPKAYSHYPAQVMSPGAQAWIPSAIMSSQPIPRLSSLTQQREAQNNVIVCGNQ